jgi:hypothetical protein
MQRGGRHDAGPHAAPAHYRDEAKTIVGWRRIHHEPGTPLSTN